MGGIFFVFFTSVIAGFFACVGFCVFSGAFALPEVAAARGAGFFAFEATGFAACLAVAFLAGTFTGALAADFLTTNCGLAGFLAADLLLLAADLLTFALEEEGLGAFLAGALRGAFLAGADFLADGDAGVLFLAGAAFLADPLFAETFDAVFFEDAPFVAVPFVNFAGAIVFPAFDLEGLGGNNKNHTPTPHSRFVDVSET